MASPAASMCPLTPPRLVPRRPKPRPSAAARPGGLPGARATSVAGPCTPAPRPNPAAPPLAVRPPTRPQSHRALLSCPHLGWPQAVRTGCRPVPPSRSSPALPADYRARSYTARCLQRSSAARALYLALGGGGGGGGGGRSCLATVRATCRLLCPVATHFGWHRCRPAPAATQGPGRAACDRPAWPSLPPTRGPPAVPCPAPSRRAGPRCPAPARSAGRGAEPLGASGLHGPPCTSGPPVPGAVRRTRRRRPPVPTQPSARARGPPPRHPPLPLPPAANPRPPTSAPPRPSPAAVPPHDALRVPPAQAPPAISAPALTAPPAQLPCDMRSTAAPGAPFRSPPCPAPPGP